MDIRVENHLDDIASPANLKINDQINRFREQCEKQGCHTPYHHFAFGQSPFPPPPSVTEALARNAEKHSYLPTAGLPALRESIATTSTSDAAGREGYFQVSLAAYGREGDSCSRCEGRIRRFVQAGRSTYYCPRCQK